MAAAGVSECSSSYHRAEQLQRELDGILEQFGSQRVGGQAAAANGGGGSTIALQQRLGGLSNEFAAAVQQVREQADGISDAKSRILWQRKAERLEANAATLQEAIEKQLGQFYKVKKEVEDREKLFGRGERDRKAKGGPDDDMRSTLKENAALRESANQLDEIISQGRSIFSNIVDQNKILKNTKKKILDVASSMGVSASLVNVIDRRNKEDKWLVYGGMILTLFILFSLWYLLRW
mmetsp:Transcript_134841/g.336452  ORF Transcript_134841/g.336452 Transcript_134841/m.336452 type:complete len:236 (-) Transcript_134841:63-770(-)